ncbi:MAG: nucleoside-diphosphate kinase [Candidatus Micrarchaeota archaeon]|nr:nucleoside-diphosphate kinase [Candidatus Micrarchaeota archaeon]
MERTLVLVKPDGVERGLTGSIVAKFEASGLKLVAIKVLKPTTAQASAHYLEDKAWMESVGNKTLKSYEAKGIKMAETALEIGQRVRNMLLVYLVDQPTVAMVLEGNEAVAAVAKMTGATAPIKADPSTIRGTYSLDSYDLADTQKRAVKNIVHASDSHDNAEREIKVWFTDAEIIQYKRADESSMY